MNTTIAECDAECCHDSYTRGVQETLQDVLTIMNTAGPHAFMPALREIERLAAKYCNPHIFLSGLKYCYAGGYHCDNPYHQIKETNGK